MIARMLAAMLTLSLMGNALADCRADRKAATDLMQTGKYEEAMPAFTKLAAGDVSEAQKSEVERPLLYRDSARTSTEPGADSAVPTTITTPHPPGRQLRGEYHCLWRSPWFEPELL